MPAAPMITIALVAGTRDAVASMARFEPEGAVVYRRRTPANAGTRRYARQAPGRDLLAALAERYFTPPRLMPEGRRYTRFPSPPHARMLAAISPPRPRRAVRHERPVTARRSRP